MSLGGARLAAHRVPCPMRNRLKRNSSTGGTPRAAPGTGCGSAPVYFAMPGAAPAAASAASISAVDRGVSTFVKRSM